MPKKNRPDLTLRNLGPVRKMRQDLKQVLRLLKQQGFQFDEVFSRLDNLAASIGKQKKGRS